MMRKRNFSYFLDLIFWYVIYSLPIIIALIFYVRTGTLVGLGQLILDCGLGVDTSSIVYTTLVGIIGTGGAFPLFSSLDLIVFLTYFINVTIAHLLVDFVLFIPRLSHKLMSKLGGGDD